MRRRGFAFISPFLICLFAESCDLFQTRDPEFPVQNKSTFNTPVTPDIVLANLRSAVGEYNVDNYMRCFVDTTVHTYEFIPSQEAEASYPTVFSRWSLDAERQYFVRLGLPTNGTPTLSLTTRNSAVSSDSVTYLLSYTFFFPHHRTDVPQVVRGNMQLTLGADNQRRWSIYRWQDFKTLSDSTWSIWKAVFSGS